MTTESLSILIYVGLLFVCLLIQANYALVTAGMAYGFSNRDELQPAKGPAGHRIDRVIGNLKEGGMMYLPLALLAVSAGISNPWTHWAALITIISRTVYVPIYILGVPLARTLIWAPSFLAIAVLAYGIYLGSAT